MVHWRCVNNLFGYCTGYPDWREKPEEAYACYGQEGCQVRGSCNLNPKNCGKFQTSTEHYAELSKLHSQTVPENSYRHTVVAKKPSRRKKEKASA